MPQNRPGFAEKSMKQDPQIRQLHCPVCGLLFLRKERSFTGKSNLLLL